MKLTDDMRPREECEDKIRVFSYCLPNTEIHATLSRSFFVKLITIASEPEPAGRTCRSNIARLRYLRLR
jgi:hypothetical protein